MRRAFLLGLALYSAGCAPSLPRTRTELDASRLELAHSLRARDRAPELWLAVEAALDRARAFEENSYQREDETALARLWLEAAISECQRADLSAKRLKVESEIARIVADTLVDRRAIRTLNDDAGRVAAAEIARGAAAKALERAASTTSRRPKLSRGVEAEAAQALLTRAELVVDAARVLSADEQAVASVQQAIDQARAAPTSRPDVSLDLSDRALSAALKLLGPLRARQAGVSESERQALFEELETQGGVVRSDDRGLSISFERVFAAGNQFSPATGRRLSRLCALTVAHPHGQLRLLARAPDAQLASLRRAALGAALPRAGCPEPRVVLDAREGRGPELELTWLAY